MLYSSCNGCFFYYDNVLYGWRIAEPTMLFLLGYEAVTTYDKSASDCLLVSKYAHHVYDDELVPMEYIDEIYDEIYKFLSQASNVEDFETYLKFNCYGLKLLLNDMTGTHTDRTVPIIFKNDTNKSLIDVNDTPYYITDLEKISMSYYDLQALKIKELFTYAGYVYDAGRELNPEYYSDELKEEIKKYNINLKLEAVEIEKYSDTFKLLDYKAMYSYALGVLYGCRCMGFDDNVIWRLDPTYWYNGEYKNLVQTAWIVFRFNKFTYIQNIDGIEDKTQFEKYKSIVNNKLWNFEEDCSSKLSTPLEDYEMPFAFLSIENNKVTAEPIIYSRFKYPPESGEPVEPYSGPGSFLTLDQSSEYYNQWRNIRSYIMSQRPRRIGVISQNDSPLIRYMANDEIKVYMAYKWDTEAPYSRDDAYLSPDNSALYFTSVGNVGWFHLNESLVSLNDSSSRTYNTLSLFPHSIEDTIGMGYAYDTADHSIVTYYQCTVNTGYSGVHTLYGMYDKYIVPLVSNKLPEHFDFITSNLDVKIISEHSSGKRYEIFISLENGYKQKTLYNLSEPINVIVNEDETKIWGGTDNPENDILIDELGYTEGPAELLDAYDSNHNSLNIRKYNDKYWAPENITYIPDGSSEQATWPGKTWNDSLPDGIYLTSSILTHLYRNIVRLTDNEIPLYTQPNTNAYYVYNDFGLEFCRENAFAKFINIPLTYDLYDDLYTTKGITSHLCQIILRDDEGNYLTEDGTQSGSPVVWYDSDSDVTKPYWNGVFGTNQWQVNKPGLFDSIMYNSLTGETKRVHDDFNNHSITIDGETISYTEFYSNPNYGIIRTQLQVFNPDKDNTRILTCYCDNTPEYERYIIPDENEMTEWVPRPDLLGVYGYWTVDGTETLYNGDISESIVFDDEHSD